MTFVIIGRRIKFENPEEENPKFENPKEGNCRMCGEHMSYNDQGNHEICLETKIVLDSLRDHPTCTTANMACDGKTITPARAARIVEIYNNHHGTSITNLTANGTLIEAEIDRNQD